MTTHNSVQRLRAEQKKTSTREFKARGAALKRCDSCLLSLSKCICSLVEPQRAELGVCMLMYHGEYYKPSNTGQLICNVVADNFAFRWQRTEVEQKLIELLADPKWYPIIVFPHDNVEQSRQINKIPSQQALMGKKPLLIFLDGTWRQAKKMFIKSPYLQQLPVLAVESLSKGGYQLREAYHDHHLSTVEVAIALFNDNGFPNLAEPLQYLFDEFKAGYKAFKR